MENAPQRWDVFCKVVDNYGDAGVAWRLARNLALEHGKRVRLWLEQLEVLAKLRPDVECALPAQTVESVENRRGSQVFEPADVADVVVETFGCEAPEGYVLAMARRKPAPRWINLEYLSAEDWVEGSHRLPSPHPRLPLVKHYFFPGFSPRTGGLIREAGLLERRDAFQAAQPRRPRLRSSVFSYPSAPLEALLRAFDAASPPVEPLVPGVSTPFVPQDRYDELLWSCDVNFVRGEDSFVRAQWAARPFVWHIYPQDQGAHWVKLSAFLARYTEGLERAEAAALTGMWEAWNRGEGVAAAWGEFSARLGPLTAHARAWAQRLARQRELTAEIVDFAAKLLK